MPTPLPPPTLPYQVIDSPTRLSSAEWGRVGCVFCQGALWQFKGWKGFESEAAFFAKVLGFHVRFSDEQPNQLVKGWNVKKLVLSKERTKQHEVGVTVMGIWNDIHKFLLCKKPHLLTKPTR